MSVRLPKRKSYEKGKKGDGITVIWGKAPGGKRGGTEEQTWREGAARSGR